MSSFPRCGAFQVLLKAEGAGGLAARQGADVTETDFGGTWG